MGGKDDKNKYQIFIYFKYVLFIPGMLSHWIQKAGSDNKNSKFILIDRGTCRYKVYIFFFLSFFKCIHFQKYGATSKIHYSNKKGP